jgi:hypothetical protein
MPSGVLTFSRPFAILSFYRKQMPGVPLVKEIGNHAITIEEFKSIYAIYKKYEGKESFVFHSERFDYDFGADVRT